LLAVITHTGIPEYQNSMTATTTHTATHLRNAVVSMCDPTAM